MAKVQTNVNPYYNDYDETKNFHQILFRPGVAVQARELTQLQDVLQNQISKVGDNLFKEGAQVIPGNTSYDLSVHYAKINQQFNSTSVNIAALEGVYVKGSTSGVVVKVLKAVPAATGETWSTLIYKTISNGGATGTNSVLVDNEILSTDDGSLAYATQVAQTLFTNSSGNSSIAVINDGTYYVGGRFVNVYKQTVVMSQYSKYPSVRVGLRVNETIVTENDTTYGSSLLDPAFGASNYNAPGAHRLRTTLTLETIGYNAVPGVGFIQLLVFNNGVIEQIVDRTVYNVIGDALARRTYEESGHYVVNDIKPKVREHLAVYDANNARNNLNGGLYKSVEYTATATITKGSNIITNLSMTTGVVIEGHTISEASASAGTYFPVGTYVTKIDGNSAYLSNVALLDGSSVAIQGGGNSNLVSIGIDPNIFFVGGYEYPTPSSTWLTVNKARSYETVSNSALQVTYGNYILIGDLFGVPSMGFRALVELRRGAITTRGTKNSRSVGMARIQGIELLSGTETNNINSNSAVYKCYITDITLAPGMTMDDVGSITSPGSIGTAQNISANVLTAYGVTSVASVTSGSALPFAKGDIIQGNTPDQKGIVYAYDSSAKTIYAKRANTSFVQFTGTATSASANITGVPAGSVSNLAVGMYVAGAGFVTDVEATTPAWIIGITLQADGTYTVALSRNATASGSFTFVANYSWRTFFASATSGNTFITLTPGTTNHANFVGSIIPNGSYLQAAGAVTATTGLSALAANTYVTSTTATQLNLSAAVTSAGTHTFAFSIVSGLRAITPSTTVTVKQTPIIVGTFLTGTTIPVVSGLQDVALGASLYNTAGVLQGYVTAIGATSITVSAAVTGVTSSSVFLVANNSSTVNNSAVVTSKTTLFESNDPTIIFELPHTAIRNNVGADGTFPPATTVTMRREQFILVADGASTTTFSLTNPDETLPSYADSKYFYGYYLAHSNASLIGTLIPASAFTITSANSASVTVTSGTNVKIGVVYTVNKAHLQQRIKTIHTAGSAGKLSNINPTNRSKIYLGVPDVTKIIGVWDSNVVASSATDVSSYVTWNGATNRWESTLAENITQNWTLDNGQRDDHYEQASISLKANAPQPQGKLIVVYEYFTATSGDYFDADSYSSLSSIYGDSYLQYIPHYTDTGGIDRVLQNCFDFRQYVSGNSNIFLGNWTAGTNKISVQTPDNAGGVAVGDTVTGQGIPDGARVYSITGNVLTLTSSYPTLTAANATTTEVSAPFSIITAITGDPTTYGYRSHYTSNMDMIVNRSNIISSYSHYLARIDKVMFNSNGRFNVIQGVPANNPSAPTVVETPERMALFDIIVPEYTYTASAIHVQPKFQKGYTMKDIGAIETRLKTLEETVSLSLLEADTNSMLIPDASGLNRFKSGFVVDNFKTQSLGDFSNPEYNIAVDAENGICRPAAQTTTIDFGFDTNSTENVNYVILDGVAMLPFTEVSAINQPWATSHISVNPFSVFTWNGTIKLDPAVDTWIDYTYLPDIVNTVYINGGKSTVDVSLNTGVTSRTQHGWDIYAGSTTATVTSTTSTTTSSIKYV